MRILLVIGACAAACFGQSVKLSNGKMELTVLLQGTGIASIVLKDDATRMNPLWHPAAGGPGVGHFLCVDGFGGVSQEERSAGFPSHGEAHLQQFAVREQTAESLQLSASLPLAQETVTRTLRLLAGEQVVSVETRIENSLSFDRPLQWAEHATVGSPFLEPGVTVIDMPASRAKTRPYEPDSRSGGLPHRLPSAQDFTWPMAPGIAGPPVDMRLTPVATNSGDHTAALMDTTRDIAWITALNPKLRLMVGYLFRRSEFPWVQTWLNFRPDGELARGMEFSTQPFDVPRRQVVTEGSLFGTPLYRWLPAKSAATAKFLMFYASVPEGWSGVRDVRLEGASILVQERAGSQMLKLPTNQKL